MTELPPTDRPMLSDTEIRRIVELQEMQRAKRRKVFVASGYVVGLILAIPLIILLLLFLRQFS